MKKLYILFALLMVVVLFAGCKKHDKEVFTSDSLEYLSSVAATASKQESGNNVPADSSKTEGTQQNEVPSQAAPSDNNTSGVQTPTASQPANSGQSSSDPLDLPVTGDNEISADEFGKPESSSAPATSSQPEETAPPTETPSEEPSSSSRPEVAPVRSDSEQWSQYF